MSTLRIEVSEPTLVRDRDGKPVGRLQPGRRYRARSVDGERVLLVGPDGSLGAVPLSAVTLTVDPPPGGAPAEEGGGPHAEAETESEPGPEEPPAEPTKRQLRKQARAQRKQDKVDRRTRAQRELAGADAPRTRVKMGKGGWIVALVVLVLLAGAAAIAVLVATRPQPVEAGWWHHTADEEVGDGDSALDLVLLVGEEEQIERGEARYDDGEFCFVVLFGASEPDPDADAISTTGTGHFCDEGTLVEMDLSDLKLRDGVLQGGYTTYAVVEGERSIVIVEGTVVLERRGAPDSADRMEQPSSWAPTSSEGQPARVARLVDPEVFGQPTTGYIEVILCPFGRLRYWQDLERDDIRVVGVGAGQIAADLEGSILVSEVSPGLAATGEEWPTVVDDENVNLFAPEGPIVVPISTDTTRRCGV